MKTLKSIKLMGLLVAGASLWGASSAVLAVGTPSDTNITNQATINFTVNGVADSEISNVTDFEVDNKVDLTVAAVTGAMVLPNSADQVLVFTVTNAGNTTQGYTLQVVPDGTDDFDMNNVRIYLDDGDSTFDAGDTLITPLTQSIGDLDPNSGVPGADTARVFVVADTPPNGGGAAPTNGQLANYKLVATTTDAGTANATTETAGADTPGAVDVVFADADGDGAGADDANRDGKHSALETYTVDSAIISITKTSTVIRDPFNNGTQPKHIPGAYVRYTITIANDAAAGASATLTTISDALNISTAFDTDLINGATGNPQNAAGNGFRIDQTSARTVINAMEYYTSANDADGAEHDGTNPGGNVSANFSNLLPADAGAGYAAGELKPGESVSLIFNVVIE